MTVRNALCRLGAAVGMLVACGLVLGPLGAAEVPVAGAATGPLPDVAGEPVPFGNAADVGSLAGAVLDAPVVGMAAAPTGGGYWMVAADGGVFAYGTASFEGSAGSQHLVSPVVGMAAAPTGGGYWLVAADGGIFSFGTAQYHGSMGGSPLNAPIVGMAATPTGGGYWLVASDGGIFSFGTAQYHGSMGGSPLNEPIVGMAAAPTGGGYWLVATDGGIFSFGTARFHGSMGDSPLYAPIAGMAAAPTGGGYWLVASDGGVFAYGTASFQGSMGGQPLTNPIVAIVATPGGGGYWVLPTSIQPILGPGDSGPAVLALQARLTSLGYWTGPENGTFGDTTEEAVYALQKAADLTPSGIVGPATWVALNRGAVPQPQSASGYVIQVDLQDDLVMFTTNGNLEHVLNTSTGGGYTFFATGVSQVAETPVGVFHIYRETDGLVVDSLGALWRPKFFDAGYAIHGDSYVPPYPVSHGCVRVSTAAIDWIWTTGLAPLGTEVWVY